MKIFANFLLRESYTRVLIGITIGFFVLVVCCAIAIVLLKINMDLGKLVVLVTYSSFTQYTCDAIISF